MIWAMPVAVHVPCTIHVLSYVQATAVLRGPSVRDYDSLGHRGGLLLY
eukprot:COSAG02_NODE_101_length_36804_cov_125.342951_9_plen_48_part_00